MLSELYSFISTPDVIDMSVYCVGLSQSIGLNRNTFSDPFGSLIGGCVLGYFSMNLGRMISNEMPSQFRGVIPIVCAGAIIASQIKHYYEPADSEPHYLCNIYYQHNGNSRFTIRVPYLVSVDL